MSLSNELKELLTGYIDNQLTVDELRKVEEALLNPSVQAHLDELVQMRAELKSLAAVPARGLPADFAQRVLSAVAESGKVVRPASPPNSGGYSPSHSYQWLPAVAGLAAAIGLAVWIPSYWNQPDDSIQITQLVEPVETEKGPAEDPASEAVLVSRDDLMILHIMTFDVELSADKPMSDTLAPLLRNNGIQLVKGATVDGNVRSALDKIRMTVPAEDAPLPTEVYLLRASNQSINNVVESMWEDETTFPTVRFGMAFELPTEPLLDKLSADDSGDDLELLQLAGGSDAITLGRSMANAIQDQVDTDDSFAAPLVTADQQEFRASPFSSIPYQGKLVGSSSRTSKSQLTLESSDDGQVGFLLLFVRQRQ